MDVWVMKVVRESTTTSPDSPRLLTSCSSIEKTSPGVSWAFATDTANTFSRPSSRKSVISRARLPICRMKLFTVFSVV